MGRKPASTEQRDISSKKLPFLKQSAVNVPDRGVTVRKNTAISEYFRTKLLSSSTPKVLARATSSEASSASVAETRHSTAEESKKSEERMFANERISVSNIYPNPVVEDYAEVDFQIIGNVNEAKILLSNVLGSPVAEHSLDRSDRRLRIPTRDWNNGVYFYTLSLDGKKVATKKFLVRHQ